MKFTVKVAMTSFAVARMMMLFMAITNMLRGASTGLLVEYLWPDWLEMKASINFTVMGEATSFLATPANSILSATNGNNAASACGVARGLTSFTRSQMSALRPLL